MLLIVVVTGMLAGLLMLGWWQAYRMKTRAQREARERQLDRRAERVFRHANQAAAVSARQTGAFVRAMNAVKVDMDNEYADFADGEADTAETAVDVIHAAAERFRQSQLASEPSVSEPATEPAHHIEHSTHFPHHIEHSTHWPSPSDGVDTVVAPDTSSHDSHDSGWSDHSSPSDFDFGHHD